MRQSIRSSAAGKSGTATPFLRMITSPKAGIVLTTQAAMPDDWSAIPDSGNLEDAVGHALGWILEVRRTDLLLMNPLGEGVVNADLPNLEAGWLHEVGQDGSCAVFLAPIDDIPNTDGPADGQVKAASLLGVGRAATVRSSVANDYGKADPVGRNQPCPCASGKKYKHCCGK